MSCRVLSVQIGQPQWVNTEEDAPLYTALGKHPVSGRVGVGELGLEGDGQADRRYHGGPDKAVLCYSAEHYAGWERELSRPGMAWGFFGENLSVAGLSEAQVCLGDLYQAGTVKLRVTQPREPCHKLSRYWRIPDLEERARSSGRTGWYLAVAEPGWVEAGVEMCRLERPAPEWNLVRVNAVLHQRQDRAEMLQLAACPHLAANWRRRLTSRAERLSQQTLF